MIVPSLLTWKGSALVLDPKGENAWRTAAYRREHYGPTYILDPFGGVERYSGLDDELPHKYRFNPLAGIASEDVQRFRSLAEALLVRDGGNEKNSHWDNSALDLLEGLLLFETDLAERQNREPSLVRVRRTITDPILLSQAAALARGNRDLAEGDIWRTPFQGAEKLRRFGILASQHNDEMKSVIATAAANTGFLDTPAIQQVLAPAVGNRMLDIEDPDSFHDPRKEDPEWDELPLFDMAELATQPGTTVYLVLPTTELETYGRWLRLMISRAISDVVSIKPDEPVLFLLDEFVNVGKLTAVERALGIAAGEGIRLWVFLQNYGQLVDTYGQQAADTFITNAEVVQFFGGGGPTTTKFFSEYLGQETITVRNKQWLRTRTFRETIETMYTAGALNVAEYIFAKSFFGQTLVPGKNIRPDFMNERFAATKQTANDFNHLIDFYFTRAYRRLSQLDWPPSPFATLFIGARHSFDQWKKTMQPNTKWLWGPVLITGYIGSLLWGLFAILLATTALLFGAAWVAMLFGGSFSTALGYLILLTTLGVLAALCLCIYDSIRLNWISQIVNRQFLRWSNLPEDNNGIQINLHSSQPLPIDWYRVTAFPHDVLKHVYATRIAGNRSYYSQVVNDDQNNIGRPLMTHDEIARMDDDQIITLHHGKPHKLKKAPYFREAEFNGAWRPTGKELGPQ